MFDHRNTLAKENRKRSRLACKCKRTSQKDYMNHGEMDHEPSSAMAKSIIVAPSTPTRLSRLLKKVPNEIATQ
jgi:hypothetical protein